MVNGIDSLISLSDFSLLVYRNASDFCVLILYLETLLNSLITSSNFLIVSLGFYIYTITLSASRRVLLFSPIQIPFIYFFLLWLPWLGLPKLFWVIVMRVGTLVLLLVLAPLHEGFNVLLLVLVKSSDSHSWCIASTCILSFWILKINYMKLHCWYSISLGLILYHSQGSYVWFCLISIRINIKIGQTW